MNETPPVKPRDVENPIALALFMLYGEKRTAQLTLDSGLIRQELAHYIMRELGNYGFEIRRKRAAHL